MNEELRFFLRTALYTGAIGIVYWFVSYEWAGTVMLAFLFGAALFFVLVVGSTSRWAPRKGNGGEPRHGKLSLRSVIGFEDEEPADSSGPLELQEDLFPTSSLWPLILATGATLLGLGLIFGPWLALPGLGIMTAAGLGWFTQLRT
ncbi:MAG TPA: cytochrome c oxidase subunit 4 [Actinomycetota bacterium]|nr:cytochrome c oxidase subunit 4 [Actinomycetota bacterium]